MIKDIIMANDGVAGWFNGGLHRLSQRTALVNKSFGLASCKTGVDSAACTSAVNSGIGCCFWGGIIPVKRFLLGTDVTAKPGKMIQTSMVIGVHYDTFGFIKPGHYK